VAIQKLPRDWLFAAVAYFDVRALLAMILHFNLLHERPAAKAEADIMAAQVRVRPQRRRKSADKT
jgi:hypothetical protein